MNLEKFRPINLTIGFPSISITSNGVTFSKAAVVKLGMPKHVVLLLNEEEKQFAVMGANEGDDNATQFVRNKKTYSVRYNNKDFLNTLEKMMKWNLDEQGWKVSGDYYSEQNLLVFDLLNGKPITGRETDGDE